MVGVITKSTKHRLICSLGYRMLAMVKPKEPGVQDCAVAQETSRLLGTGLPFSGRGTMQVARGCHIRDMRWQVWGWESRVLGPCYSLPGTSYTVLEGTFCPGSHFTLMSLGSMNAVSSLLSDRDGVMLIAVLEPDSPFLFTWSPCSSSVSWPGLP
jgi:hypothetical protein